MKISDGRVLPPILAINAYATDGEAWSPVRARLEAQGHRWRELRFEAWTRPHPFVRGGMLKLYVDTARTMIASMDERPLLVGSHAAALAALLIAQIEPRTIAGVVAVSPAGFGMPRLVRRATQPGVAGALRTMARMLPNTLRAVAARGLYRYLSGAPVSASQALIDAASERDQAVELVDRTTALLTEARVMPEPVPDPSCPTLLIGTDGRIARARFPEQRAGLWITWVEAGHFAHVEAPDKIARLIHVHASGFAGDPR